MIMLAAVVLRLTGKTSGRDRRRLPVHPAAGRRRWRGLVLERLQCRRPVARREPCWSSRRAAASTRIADVLAKAGVIEHPLVFKIGVQLLRRRPAAPCRRVPFPDCRQPARRHAGADRGQGRCSTASPWPKAGRCAEVFDVLDGLSPMLEGPLPPPPRRGIAAAGNLFLRARRQPRRSWSTA